MLQEILFSVLKKTIDKTTFEKWSRDKTPTESEVIENAFLFGNASNYFLKSSKICRIFLNPGPPISSVKIQNLVTWIGATTIVI